MLLGTFVQREICGTDSSCLPTTVGQVQRERERDAPSAERRRRKQEGREGRGAGARGQAAYKTDEEH